MECLFCKSGDERIRVVARFTIYTKEHVLTSFYSSHDPDMGSGNLHYRNVCNAMVLLVLTLRQG
jgi:hypothetical protein